MDDRDSHSSLGSKEWSKKSKKNRKKSAQVQLPKDPEINDAISDNEKEPSGALSPPFNLESPLESPVVENLPHNPDLDKESFQLEEKHDETVNLLNATVNKAEDEGSTDLNKSKTSSLRMTASAFLNMSMSHAPKFGISPAHQQQNKEMLAMIDGSEEVMEGQPKIKSNALNNSFEMDEVEVVGGLDEDMNQVDVEKYMTINCNDISMVNSYEESYYMNPKAQDNIELAKRDIKVRETLIKDVSVKVETTANMRQDNYLALQAFRLVIKINNEKVTTVSRRFNDFIWLEKALQFQFFGRIIPKAPPKNFLTKLKLNTEVFMKQRKLSLERFCSKILNLKEVNVSDHVFYFFFMPRKELTLHVENSRTNMVETKQEGIANIPNIIKNLASSLMGGQSSWDASEIAESILVRRHEVKNLKETFSKFHNNFKMIIQADIEAAKALDQVNDEARRLERGMINEPQDETEVNAVPNLYQDLNHKALEILEAMDHLEKDLLDLYEVFVRRDIFEEYMNSLRVKMEGKDRNEFSDYSIMERSYMIVADKFRMFSEELEKDYTTYVADLRQQMKTIMAQTSTYYL